MLAATRTSTSKAAFKVATASSTRSLSVTACRMQRPSTPPPQQPHKPAHLSPLSPSAPPQRVGGYSPLTVSLVKGLAKLMGYNSKTSTAIRVTSDLYDLAAQQSHFDEHFWHNECGLPRTYQTWFQVTNLHVYLLLVRFRALQPNDAAAYSQELMNHFFIDAESRMRSRFGVQTSRLVKGYMRDLHLQHRGAVLGLDEGLAHVSDDARLAAALWRNVWGQGWGVVGGVKRKVKGIDKTAKGEDDSEEGTPVLAQDRGEQPAGAGAYAQAAAQLAATSAPSPAPGASPSAPTGHPAAPGNIDETPAFAAFPIHLERLTTYVRRETLRLASISDAEVMLGRTANDRTLPPPDNVTSHNSASVGASDVIAHQDSVASPLKAAATNNNDDAQRSGSIADFGSVM